MSAQTLPLDLFKAQLELQLQLNRLLQESGQQWLEHAARTAPEDVAGTGAEIESLHQSDSWQELATLPAQAFWRQAHLHMGHTQALAQSTVATQMAFAQGLQQALQSWQSRVAETVGGASASGAQGLPAMQKLFTLWASTLRSATMPAQAAPAAANGQ